MGAAFSAFLLPRIPVSGCRAKAPGCRHVSASSACLMLVLRRRAGEAIAIGGGIEIEVIEISRTRVKLGVTAPRGISVLRKETIAVAAEHRKALAFVSSCGSDGLNATLRQLGDMLRVQP